MVFGPQGGWTTAPLHGLPQSKRLWMFRNAHPLPRIDDLIDKSIGAEPSKTTGSVDQVQGAQLTVKAGQDQHFSRSHGDHLPAGHEVGQGQGTTTQNGQHSRQYWRTLPTTGRPYGAFWVWQVTTEILSQNFAARYRPSHPAH
ncbi:hypothetical protein GWK47_049514 [Chionoecetes opilio]|uniref:Uncharacterized protein n=1 Tax=Chionoecetes opilio TaxID=41210 RepID=A0A8J4Y983_CHIOP|nr:hypothetical protein GWK47_049514 [Chionoecetes opilio]